MQELKNEVFSYYYDLTDFLEDKINSFFDFIKTVAEAVNLELP